MDGNGLTERVKQLERRMDKADQSHDDFIALRSDVQSLVREVNRLRTEEVQPLRESVGGLEKGQGRNFLVGVAAIVGGLVAFTTLLLTAGALPG